MPGEPGRSGASVTVLRVDIVSLLINNPVAIMVGLIGGVFTILAVLITRGTMRGSSRKQRTDEYRRDVRSAASSVVSAARTFIDAAKAFRGSIFWIKDAVRSTPGHDERYLACKKAKAELDGKLAEFELLVNNDMLSKAAIWVKINSTMADCATFNISFSSQWSTYTETQLEDELELIHKHTVDLEKKALPKFLECVKECVPHTIVEEKRRRARILRPFASPWRWLRNQHRKNFPSSSPKQKPAADRAAPAVGDHAST